MQKIVPCLWFDGNGEDAVKFYSAIFPNSRVTDTLLWGDVNPSLKGKLLTATFELDGQEFMVLNGGPQYKFNPAISMS
jgi:predicted 3-demethylubiquinone-9 3-methyltransferase (glyoxalase superfamily)